MKDYTCKGTKIIDVRKKGARIFTFFDAFLNKISYFCITNITLMNYWFVFHKNDVLLKQTADGTYTIPFGDSCPFCLNEGAHVLNVTPMADGTLVNALETSENVNSAGYEWCDLRKSYYKLSPELYQKAGKCHELLYWDINTQYCGRCGEKLVMDTEISKVCPKCGKLSWPLLATAIIVLINKGDNLLLVHAKNFKTDFYGCIAGFVETGESLEEAVQREVMEETSLKIKNLRYFKSQPWPYPCGLMVGYFAEYESGELKLQESELSKGGWFHKDALPTIPEKLSLARMLIDRWLEEHA